MKRLPCLLCLALLVPACATSSTDMDEPTVGDAGDTGDDDGTHESKSTAAGGARVVLFWC